MALRGSLPAIAHTTFGCEYSAKLWGIHFRATVLPFHSPEAEEGRKQIIWLLVNARANIEVFGLAESRIGSKRRIEMGTV